MNSVIQCSELLYSKSVFDDDYRCISCRQKLERSELPQIDSDYSRIFAQDEESRQIVINDNTMVVRRFRNAWAFFKFFMTNNKDSFGRTIYALYGYVFHDYSAVKISDVISSVSAYFFNNLYKEIWEKKYKSKTLDSIMAFPLNKVYDGMKEDEQTTIQNHINLFLLENMAYNGFIINKHDLGISIKTLN